MRWLAIGMAAFAVATAYRGARRGRRIEESLQRIEHEHRVLRHRLLHEHPPPQQEQHREQR